MTPEGADTGCDIGAATGSVVLPAHNEGGIIADTLRKVADTLRAELPERTWEIVVIDDGSADDTATRATEAAGSVAAAGVAVRVLQHPVNRGLGAALQTGIAASSGDVVVIADCDLSYSPDHLPRLVHALEQNSAKVALASPYMPGGTTLGVPARIERRSRAANRFLARASGVPLHTLTGMVRAYDGPFVRQLALKSTGDVINVEALYKTQVLRGRVVEVPATLDWRGLEVRAGRSRRGTRRARTKTYQTVASGLLFRPYGVFILAGLSLMTLGGALGLLAMVMAGTQVELTVLGSSSIVAGVLVGFLSLLSLQVKRCFEELYFTQSRVRGLVGRVVRHEPVVTSEPAPSRAPALAPDGIEVEVPAGHGPGLSLLGRVTPAAGNVP
jgi:hypothetical protein